MNTKAHDRFSAEYSLTPKMLADYALSVGDLEKSCGTSISWYDLNE